MIRTLLVLFAFTMLGCAVAAPESEALPSRGMTKMEKDFVASSYAPLTKASDIPFAVRVLIAPHPHPIANPGEEFNDTDYADPAKPTVQLVFGGVATGSAFVLYRRGSLVGPLAYLLIARMDGETVTSYCLLLLGPQSPADPKELQATAAKGVNPHNPPAGHGCS